MEATELRIGNKLQKSNGEIFTVSRLDESCDVLVKEHRGLLTLGYNLTGIQLTEEILLKCEFKKKNGYKFVLHNSHFSLVRIDSATREEYAFSHYNLWVNLEYVHQLQNLYFAITGQELEINL